MPEHAAPTDVDAAHLAALRELGAATVGESGGHAMGPAVRAIWRGARLAAPAFTVRCSPGDNLGVHVAVTRAPAGRVLVVDVGGDESYGYWGEVLTTGAEARGLAGLVIGGGVRDTAALEAHGFPVFATTVALRGASKVSARGRCGARGRGGVAVHDRRLRWWVTATGWSSCAGQRGRRRCSTPPWPVRRRSAACSEH